MEKDGENNLERQDVQQASTRNGGREADDDERDYGKKTKVDRPYFESRRIVEKSDGRAYLRKATKEEGNAR